MPTPRLTFNPMPVPEARKTAVWSVVGGGDIPLGTVTWCAHWRRYCFCPTTAGRTIFDPGCLRELADFCEGKTREHKS